MAATALTAQIATPAGMDIIYSTPTQLTGHTAPTGVGFGLIVKNTTGGTTITLYTPGTVDGLPIGDRSIAVTAGHDELIPLDSTLYGDPSTGLATFDITGTAGNTLLACVSVGG